LTCLEEQVGSMREGLDGHARWFRKYAKVVGIVGI
jgi:hypothetical protein